MLRFRRPKPTIQKKSNPHHTEVAKRDLALCGARSCFMPLGRCLAWQINSTPRSYAGLS